MLEIGDLFWFDSKSSRCDICGEEKLWIFWGVYGGSEGLGIYIVVA